MEPRLKTSKKWTSYPKELQEQIREVVEVFFADYDVGDGRFVIDGSIYPEEILLRIGITRPGQLRQDNFEASMQFDPKVDKAFDLIHVLTDFLGEAWINFLEDAPEDEDLPRQWQKNTFEKREIYLKYSTVNTDLEEQANRLLQEDEKKLVYGEDDDLESIELSNDEATETDSDDLSVH